MGTTSLEIIAGAGFTPWPRLYNNLRSSRESAPVAAHPAHVASEWVGHHIKIAKKHYLKAIDRDFAAAFTRGKNATLQMAEVCSDERQPVTANVPNLPEKAILPRISAGKEWPIQGSNL
ncbi:MAG TPA: hypothetical protein VGB55_13630 [Tepidisphaeraceae bacterium]